MIESNDGGASDALSRVEAAYAGMADQGQFDSLRDALSDFDFEGALSRLNDLENQLASNLSSSRERAKAV
jgi:hypothetical protein